MSSSNLKMIGFFGLCFALGLSVFFSISEEMIVQREPAAINGKLYQISGLSSEQIKRQLTNKIRISSVIDGQKTLRLEGLSASLCKTYTEIEVEFVGDGVAVAGEPPTMKVKAPCEAGQDPAELATVNIPFEKILEQKPRNAEFRFDGYTPRFEFKNTADSWPRTWILKSVNFTGKTVTNKLVKLDDDKKHLVVMEF